MIATLALPLGLLLAGAPHRQTFRGTPRAVSTLSAAEFVSEAAAKVLPSVALLFEEGEASHGTGCMIKAGTETMLLTSASVARTEKNASLEVALAGDGYSARHPAKVVGKVPEVNLVLMSVDLDDAVTPSTLAFSDDGALSEGDFVIALGNPQGPRGGASLGLLVGRSSSSMNEAPPTTPGTTEAAMAEAEAELEAEALKRGEEPFLVADAALVDGASGGPMLDADGAVVGISTLVISAGEGSTRYYAVSCVNGIRTRAPLELEATIDQADSGSVLLKAAHSNPVVTAHGAA